MKKKPAKSLADIVEQVVRDALYRCPELQMSTGISELQYCEAVDEGLSMILEGNTMRLNELRENDD